MTMSYKNLLNFGRKKTPMIYQSEVAECGLACLAMVAAAYGREIDLLSLRRLYSPSSRGLSLADIVRVASNLDFITRSVRLEPESLGALRAPAILHWDMNHFVVLLSSSSNGILIHDPAKGRRTVSKQELGKHFTGVALELTPSQNFRRETVKSRLPLRSIWENSRGVVKVAVQIIFASIALQFLVLSGPWFVQIVVDQVLLTADMSLLLVLAVGFGLLVLVQVAIAAFRSFMVLFLGTNLGIEMSGSLMRHLLKLPDDFFGKRHLGDVASRFSSVDAIQRTLTTSFIEAIVDGLVVAITLVVMFLYNVTLTLVVVTAVSIYLIFRYLIFTPGRQAIEDILVAQGRKESLFMESLRGIQSIRVANREAWRLDLFMNQLCEEKNAEIRAERWKIFAKAVNGSIFGLENILAVWLGASLVIGGSLSVGMLLAFLAYKVNFASKASAMIDKVIDFRLLGLHLERISDIALAEVELLGGQNGLTSQEVIKGTIEVRNLSFRYSDSEPWLLDSLNFTINAGESVAITGPSGSGKTTLIKLLMGILKPQEGEILIDGVSLSHFSFNEYREKISAVLQEDQLFAGSISDNICFFGDVRDTSRIIECAKAAQIHGDIISMPMRYETLVGDMGSSLSGGQKQRVILARALYRNPKIIFLDEATSHLDENREREINDALQALDITRVVVAHRKETVMSADRKIDLSEINSAASPAKQKTVIGVIKQADGH